MCFGRGIKEGEFFMGGWRGEFESLGMGVDRSSFISILTILSFGGDEWWVRGESAARVCK